MNKFNPLQYITDVDPVAEEAMDASQWFETEYIELTGIRVNTPTSVEDAGAEHISWFLAQGWVLYDTTYTHRSVSGTTVALNVRYFLKRRKLQAERVLQDMITEFTDAYNEGRSINDGRYDELVTLYSVMLDKTEDELTAMASSTDGNETVISGVLALLPTDFAAFKSDVDAVVGDLGSGREDQINIRFDAKLAQLQADLVNRGIYNTTTWPTVSAGIERERQLALSDLAGTLAGQKISAASAVHGARTGMRSGLLAAYERMSDRIRAKQLTPTEVRNSVLSAMFNFMERRTDEYPGLGDLAGIASQLGFSEGAAMVSPS